MDSYSPSRGTRASEATLRSLKSHNLFETTGNNFNAGLNRKNTLPSLSTTHKRNGSNIDHNFIYTHTDRPRAITPLRDQDTSPHRPAKSLPKGIPELNIKTARGSAPHDSMIGSTYRAGMDSVPRSLFMDNELQYYDTPATSQLQSGQASPRTARERIDIGYVKQEEHIKKNPHFQKFHNSLHIIDKAETIKFSFPREFFWSTEQVQYNEIMRKTATRGADGDQQQIKLLKDGKKETINLYQGRTTFFRVRAENKVFPMFINVTSRTGAFEGIVGKTDSVLKLRDYDCLFSTNELKVTYDHTDTIKYMYIAITAMERLKMDLSVKFSPSEESKKKEVLSSTTSDFKEKSKYPSTKKNTYEFFRQGMKTEEFEELRDLASQIRKEKRIKSLGLANNRDLVQTNIETVREYKTIKIVQLENNGTKRDFMIQKNRENKVLVKAQKEKDSIINSYRHKIKRLEIEWKDNEERERQEKIRHQSEWLVTLAINNLIKSIQTKKRTRIVIRIFERARETKIIKIQRLVRKFLQRPLVLKYGHEKHLINTLAARIALRMFNALNSTALVCHRSKVNKAENLVLCLFEQAHVPLGVTKAFDLYYSIIVKIQRRWKGQMEMFHARVEVFLVYWHQFCLSLITGEFKKKKKKYSESIPLIKEARVTVMAKQFIQHKMTSYIREVRDYENRQTNDENSEDATPRTPADQHDSSFHRGNSIQKSVRSGDHEAGKKDHNSPAKSPGKVRGSSKAPQLKLFKQIMMSTAAARPKLKIKPTNEELRDILDKLIVELKGTHL